MSNPETIDFIIEHEYSKCNCNTNVMKCICPGETGCGIVRGTWKDTIDTMFDFSPHWGRYCINGVRVRLNPNRYYC